MLLSWTALFAACSGQKIPMGHLKSPDGKTIVGDVYVTNRKTMRIENFRLNLTGAGDVVWMFGHEGTPNDTGTVATYYLLENGLLLSQPLMVLMRRRVFKNDTLQISLPQQMDTCGDGYPGWMIIRDLTKNMTLADLVMRNETTSMVTKDMCPVLPPPTSVPTPTATFTTNITSSPTPTPPACTKDYGSSNYNCTKLTNGFGVCWTQYRRLGKFVLCANNTGPGEYMAFGWSRNVKKTAMLKADAVVCSHHSNGTWDVEDYYLESRKPCGTNERGEAFGVCPDTTFGEDSHIAGTSGFYKNGVGYCTFKRGLYTSRKHDRKVTVKKPQAIVWAIGPVGEDGQIQKHSKSPSATQFFNFVDDGQRCELSDPNCCCYNIIRE